MPPVTDKQLEIIKAEFTIAFGKCLRVELEEDALEYFFWILEAGVKKGVKKKDGREWWKGELPNGLNGRDYTLHAACKLALHLNPKVGDDGVATKEMLEEALREVEPKLRAALSRKYKKKANLELMDRICPT